MVTWLDPVEQHLVSGETLRGANHPHNPLAHEALHGDAAAHAELAERYEAMSREWRSWTDTHAAHYTLSLEHGLGRLPAGWTPSVTAELSAGAGAGTRCLADRGLSVIAVDPLASMLRSLMDDEIEVRGVVQARSDQLPFASGSVELIVGLNAVADVHEMRRVLAPGGRVLWCFSFSTQTPLHVDAEMMASLLGARATAQRVGPGEWQLFEEMT